MAIEHKHTDKEMNGYLENKASLLPSPHMYAYFCKGIFSLKLGLPINAIAVVRLLMMIFKILVMFIQVEHCT